MSEDYVNQISIRHPVKLIRNINNYPDFMFSLNVLVQYKKECRIAPFSFVYEWSAAIWAVATLWHLLWLVLFRRHGHASGRAKCMLVTHRIWRGVNTCCLEHPAPARHRGGQQQVSLTNYRDQNPLLQGMIVRGSRAAAVEVILSMGIRDFY